MGSKGILVAEAAHVFKEGIASICHRSSMHDCFGRVETKHDT